jgi:hypothetical protein
VRRLQALSLIVLAALSAASVGCGQGGAASGATVAVYAAAPLCREARAGGGTAGDLQLRVVCLAPYGTGGVDLAAAGAAARRAIEDSSSVAFLEAPGPAARFSRSIVEAAGVAWVETSSGSTAMHRIRRALQGSPSSPRQAVLDEVG